VRKKKEIKTLRVKGKEAFQIIRVRPLRLGVGAGRGKEPAAFDNFTNPHTEN
jgi:hypothetical protein